jgi:hypothetical protein
LRNDDIVTQRYTDTGQAIAIREGTVPNAGDGIRNADIGQAAAIFERIISNTGDGIGNTSFPMLVI